MSSCIRISHRALKDIHRGTLSLPETSQKLPKPQAHNLKALNPIVPPKWMEYGFGNHFNKIPIHPIFCLLKEDYKYRVWFVAQAANTGLKRFKYGLLEG